MKNLPAWIGWPGTGPAPGHDWLPGPKLRFTILFLTYSFLALALTVDFAYGVIFFLLAIIGMYVGLRRGFVNGLTRAEKLVMIAFAAYPAVAIVSYLVGTQTNVGFRFLGRDLRFLLFIPVYLAIRWVRPKPEHIGWAMAGAAVGACVMAALQNHPWPAPTPHGVAGTHITFGDLALLSGFMAAATQWLTDVTDTLPSLRATSATVSLVGIGAGISASILSQSRGSWLAVPVLIWVLVLHALSHRGASATKRLLVAATASSMALVGAWCLPGTRDQVLRAYYDFHAYLVSASPAAVSAHCVDSRQFLLALMRKSRAQGTGTARLVHLPDASGEFLHRYGCSTGYAIELSAPAASHGPFEFGLYRGNWPSGVERQSAAILARGQASFNLGWQGRWVRIREFERWRKYQTTKHYPKTELTRRANLLVNPGSRVLVVPLQERLGEFAYPLAESSVGHRLVMWHAAWELFLSNPWFGAGTGSFQALGERSLGRSAVASIIGDFEHAHSDYFTSLGTRGIIGLLSTLLLLLAPLYLIRSGAGGRCSLTTRLSVSMLICGFLIFSITETMFIHSLVISWFVVVTAAVASRRTVTQPWALPTAETN